MEDTKDYFTPQEREAMEVRARRLKKRARYPDVPAPACVIRQLLPVLGASASAMRPTLVPAKKKDA
jgi:hypothetical protein